MIDALRNTDTDGLDARAAALDADDPLNRGRLTIARLRHTGGWDTAPNALHHVRLSLENIGIDMSPLSPTIPANDETLFNFPLVYMHGRTNFALTEEDRGRLTYIAKVDVAGDRERAPRPVRGRRPRRVRWHRRRDRGPRLP